MIDPLGPGAPGEVWACSRAEFLGPDCEGYRLPSRAEWELAARARSPLCLPRQFDPPRIGQCLPNGPTQTAYAIWCANSDGGYRPCIDEHDIGFDDDMDCVGPMPVRTTRANDFGLYEVFGNILEYTQIPARLPVRLPVPEPRWQPPFPIDDEPEFFMTVTRADALTAMGGDLTSDSGGTMWLHPYRKRQHR